MARKKAAANDAAESLQEPAAASSSKLAAPGDTGPRDVIKANNANLTELKHTLDDAIKRLLGRPELFKTNHQHTDVRLVLGWAGVLIAAGTALYGWKVEFEASKPVVWAGMILYILLTGAQTLYAYFVERDIVYVGKRKTFAKRIETEHITVESRTKPSTPTTAPQYELSLTYFRSSNSGKSLLHRGKGHDVRGYNTFFDEEGTLNQDAFDEWVRGLVAKVTGDESK